MVIEMQEVTLVDLDVVRFLTGCEAQGITIRGCSAYIREWIDRERQHETESPLIANKAPARRCRRNSLKR